MTQKTIKTQEKRQGERGFAQGRIFPIFETMAEAAARIGVPESLIKAAKRKGSKAFISGSRIDSALLIPFLFNMLAKGSDLPEGFASWKEVLESEKAKREAIKRQVDEKSVMPTADAQRQAAKACGFVDAELQRGENELPPVLAGLSAVECGKILHNFTEKVRTNAKSKFQEVGK